MGLTTKSGQIDLVRSCHCHLFHSSGSCTFSQHDIFTWIREHLKNHKCRCKHCQISTSRLWQSKSESLLLSEHSKSNYVPSVFVNINEICAQTAVYTTTSFSIIYRTAFSCVLRFSLLVRLKCCSNTRGFLNSTELQFRRGEVQLWRGLANKNVS